MIKKGISREPVTLAIVSIAPTLDLSIFPDKSIKLSLINNPHRFNISSIASCKQVCINQQGTYHIIILPVYFKVPKYSKSFNITVSIFFNNEYLELSDFYFQTFSCSNVTLNFLKNFSIFPLWLFGIITHPEESFFPPSSSNKPLYLYPFCVCS